VTIYAEVVHDTVLAMNEEFKTVSIKIRLQVGEAFNKLSLKIREIIIKIKKLPPGVDFEGKVNSILPT
jgi:predicted sulfurtransferase